MTGKMEVNEPQVAVEVLAEIIAYRRQREHILEATVASQAEEIARLKQENDAQAAEIATLKNKQTTARQRAARLLKRS